MKKHLLEFIFDHTKEVCISDLKNPKILKSYIPDIIQIEDKGYTIEDWKYVYTYLTGKKIDGSIDDIKKSLEKWVK